MKISNRKRARKLALQAAYQWQMNPEPASFIAAQFLAEVNAKKVDAEYFSVLLTGIIQNMQAVDAEISPFLDRKISELNPVELAVLRLATYELVYQLEVPGKVVINEALELAKAFGSVEGHKYVNGVLDKIAQKVRSKELSKK